MIVPASMDRPSIDSVIKEIMQQEWYKDQIIDRRVFDEKEGTIGMSRQWGSIYQRFSV
jgi:DEAD/DEAH box helicase domain-containing protein